MHIFTTNPASWYQNMWYDSQRVSHPPNLRTKQVTTRSSMIGKTYTINRVVKDPKINEAKLLIKYENRPNLQTTRNSNDNDILNKPWLPAGQQVHGFKQAHKVSFSNLGQWWWNTTIKRIINICWILIQLFRSIENTNT